MYAMDTPLAGGMNRLASAAQVYNEIAATRPDLIKVLAADNWPFENKYAYVLDPLFVELTPSTLYIPCRPTYMPDIVSPADLTSCSSFPPFVACT
jgi:hypothetical protein